MPGILGAFLLTGCAFFSPDAYEAQARYEKRLDPLIGTADTTTMYTMFGWPMQKTGRTWSYRYNKGDSGREPAVGMNDGASEQEFEILYLTFDEKGILRSWDVLTYYRSWLSKLF